MVVEGESKVVVGSDGEGEGELEDEEEGLRPVKVSQSVILGWRRGGLRV